MSPYHAKKRLGQNFLKSETVISKIIDTIAPSKADNIIEIGPGQGALTQRLVESGANIIAVEFDSDMIRYLDKQFRSAENITLLNTDILTYTPTMTNYKLVGNLPYNITSPVLDWTVKHHADIKSVFYMMQKEVAERVSSSPGSRDWSPLALFTQLYFDIEIVFNISPKHFSPPPKVTSSLVQLTPVKIIEIDNFKLFDMVVRQSFSQRRKTLVNNLSPQLVSDSTVLKAVLTDIGLDTRVRAEQMSTESFLKLTSVLTARKLIKEH